jgi:hypothetical protein
VSIRVLVGVGESVKWKWDRNKPPEHGGVTNETVLWAILERLDYICEEISSKEIDKASVGTIILDDHNEGRDGKSET